MGKGNRKDVEEKEVERKGGRRIKKNERQSEMEIDRGKKEDENKKRELDEDSD